MLRFRPCLYQFSDPVNCAKSDAVKVWVAMLVPSMPHHPTRPRWLQGVYFPPRLRLQISPGHFSACAGRLKNRWGISRSSSRALVGKSCSRSVLDGCSAFPSGSQLALTAQACLLALHCEWVVALGILGAAGRPSHPEKWLRRAVYHFVYHCDRELPLVRVRAIFGQRKSPLI